MGGASAGGRRGHLGAWPMGWFGLYGAALATVGLRSRAKGVWRRGYLGCGWWGRGYLGAWLREARLLSEANGQV
jgi:hypothetical protein